MRVFKPIIKIFERLKYVERFSLIGLILGIPMIIAIFISIYSVNGDINMMQTRKNGTTYHQLLIDLLESSQEHRGLSISYLSGNESNKLYMKEKQIDVEKNLQAIEQYIQTSYFSTEVIHTFHVIHKQWQVIYNSIEYIDLQSAMNLQSTFIEMIIKHMAEVADMSALYLTNHREIYYMVHDVVHVLPFLTEKLGQIRVLGMRTMTQQHLSEEDQSLLATLSSSVEHYLNQLEHGHDVMFNAKPFFVNHNRLKEMSQTMQQKIVKCLDDIHDLLIVDNGFGYSNEFFTLATSCLTEVFSIYNEEIGVLQDQIDEHLSTLKAKRMWMILLTLIVFTLTVYCLVGLYHSIRRSIDESQLSRYLFLYRYLFFPQIQTAEKRYRETELKLHKMEKNVSKQVLDVQEEEKKRVSRELHDGIGQSLYSILVALTVGERGNTPATIKESIQQAKELTVSAMNEVKRIARSLRPSILDDLGFIPALNSYIEDFQKIHSIQVKLVVDQPLDRLEPEHETVLFRVCQEALINIAKHAQATLIHLNVSQSNTDVRIMIGDNGIGFNIDQFIKDEKHQGIGLLSMKERVEGVYGTINISSTIGKGTNIDIRIPTSTQDIG